MRKTLIVCLVVLVGVFILHSQWVVSEEQKGPFPLTPLKFGLQKVNDLQGEDDFFKEIELFTDALTLIRSDYVEEAEYKDLIYGALKGMLRSLDDYSQFLTPEEYNEVMVETEGEFGGLGIEIAIRDGLLTVISPIDDTPAFRVGLKANDRIVKIDEEITREITLLEAVKQLRGKPGTKVKLTIMREGAEKLLDFTITRDIIKIKSIRKVKLFDDQIGYIRLAEFQERSPEDLEQALGRLEKIGMEGLVLDLRNNPGGLLNVAVEVTEKFIPAGKVIVSTQGRSAGQDMVFKSAATAKSRDYPLIILINQGSASGSEIVAGAIQDYKKGILLGTKTFGKGSVQTVVPLSDGSALRLTTSKYFTPTGRSIHDKGVEPDVEVKLQEQTPQEVSREEVAFEKVEEQDKDEQEEKANPKEENDITTTLEEFIREQGFYDNQLVRAVDLLKGIRLYNQQAKLQQDCL